MIQECLIHENRHLKGRFYILTLNNERIAREAQPGQFLHIQVQPSIHPLLRRPFSIYRLKDSFVDILYEVIGEGTHILSLRGKGEYINCHGPLGNWFSEDLTGKSPLLVGGGIGIAPLLFFGERLLETSHTMELVLGYRSDDDVIGLEDFSQSGMELEVTTNDGSYGHKGFVTDLLKDKLHPDHKVFACGPIPMLKAVSDLCSQKGIPCDVSIHNFMGCGFGVCLGCVFPSHKGYQRVCKDGPVFNASDLIF